MEYPMIHICYRVMDLEASEDFYRKAFGFEISRKKDFPTGGFTLSYMTSAGLPFELELTYNYDQQEAYVIGNGYSHLAVGVTDLEASHKKHIDLGLNPRAWWSWSFFCAFAAALVHEGSAVRCCLRPLVERNRPTRTSHREHPGAVK